MSLALIKGCVPVDGDTYDVPMQIQTVGEKRGNGYKKKFGDEDSQKDLSPVTHVAKGKDIPPFLILHVAEHPETKGQSTDWSLYYRKQECRQKPSPQKGRTMTRSIPISARLTTNRPRHCLSFWRAY